MIVQNNKQIIVDALDAANIEYLLPDARPRDIDTKWIKVRLGEGGIEVQTYGPNGGAQERVDGPVQAWQAALEAHRRLDRKYA